MKKKNRKNTFTFYREVEVSIRWRHTFRLSSNFRNKYENIKIYA